MAGRGAFPDLATVPLFSACSKKELQLLAKRTERIHVEPGKVVVREGAAGAEFFVIISGEAVISRRGRTVAVGLRADGAGGAGGAPEGKRCGG